MEIYFYHLSFTRKKSISHENSNIRDISYKWQVFPLQVTVSYHQILITFFLLHLKASEYVNHYHMMKSPILTL